MGHFKANTPYRNEDGRYLSLLVEDGEAVTISAKDAHAVGTPLLEMRPCTTAALLVLAGRPPLAPPHLSDSEAFKRVKSTEGLVNLSELDQDGNIAGYSVPFISGVLDALDPNVTVPPASLQWQVPDEKAKIVAAVGGGARCRAPKLSPAQSLVSEF